MILLSPLLVWGALLGAIPVIIHLLNRRRFRRVDWAPMRHLKLAVQRNRRRIRLEELLLLLLRVALLVLLFLALARPVLGPTGLERWLGRGGGAAEIVLLDDSASMGRADDEGPAFARALRVASALAESAPPQDRFTLTTTSAPKAPLVRDVAGSSREELAAAVSAAIPTATRAVWSTVLAGIDDLLKSSATPTRRLTIVTDLRRDGWDSGVAEIARRWADGNLAVRVVDVGSESTSNVSIRSLEPLDRTILAGAASEWEAVIENRSPRTLADVKAVLRVDDKPAEISLPEIAPGATVRVPIAATFPEAGPRSLTLRLPDDELPVDSSRAAAIEARDSLLIRLVDGEPSPEPFGSEVDFLAAPLSIGVGAAEAWRVEVMNDRDDFLSPRLETPDVLVLANVADPSPAAADRLRRLVRDGMGLMIFPGARTDMGLYNDLFFRAEPRLLPFPFRSPIETAFLGLAIEPARPSPLEKLLDLKASAFDRVPIRWIAAVDEEAGKGDDVRTLARWNDPDRSPAVAERVVGAGRVLLWTTTADRAGNDWPAEPSFVMAIREAVKGVARASTTANVVAAGEPIRRVVHSDQEIANARLVPPETAEPQALTAVPLPENPADDEGPATRIDVPDTRRAGVYRMSWEEGPLGPRGDVFAANPDPRESLPERIPADEVRKLLQPLNVEVVAARGLESSGSVGREIWRDLAVALLVLLVAESAMAAWASRSR